MGEFLSLVGEYLGLVLCRRLYCLISFGVFLLFFFSFRFLVVASRMSDCFFAIGTFQGLGVLIMLWVLVLTVLRGTAWSRVFVVV